MDSLIPDFAMDGGVEASSLAIVSPGYFAPVPGGDLYPQGEVTLSFPQCSTMLGCGEGTQTQDGTSGDPHDTSGLWQTLAGIGGSFLKAFTGSSTGKIQIGGSTGTAPKPPTAAATASNTTMLIVLAAAAVIIVILATRK